MVIKEKTEKSKVQHKLETLKQEMAMSVEGMVTENRKLVNKLKSYSETAIPMIIQKATKEELERDFIVSEDYETDFSDKILTLFKSTLIQGLKEKTTLNEVTLNIVESMKATFKGSWYCNIRPADLTTSVAMHQVSAIRLSFKRGNVEYYAGLAKTHN